MKRQMVENMGNDQDMIKAQVKLYCATRYSSQIRPHARKQQRKNDQCKPNSAVRQKLHFLKMAPTPSKKLSNTIIPKWYLLFEHLNASQDRWSPWMPLCTWNSDLRDTEKLCNIRHRAAHRHVRNYQNIVQNRLANRVPRFFSGPPPDPPDVLALLCPVISCG